MHHHQRRHQDTAEQERKRLPFTAIRPSAADTPGHGADFVFGLCHIDICWMIICTLNIDSLSYSSRRFSRRGLISKPSIDVDFFFNHLSEICPKFSLRSPLIFFILPRMKICQKSDRVNFIIPTNRSHCRSHADISWVSRKGSYAHLSLRTGILLGNVQVHGHHWWAKLQVRWDSEVEGGAGCRHNETPSLMSRWRNKDRVDTPAEGPCEARKYFLLAHTIAHFMGTGSNTYWHCTILCNKMSKTSHPSTF